MCGFRYELDRAPTIGPMIIEQAEAIAEFLTMEKVHDRPAPEIWSPLEYGCHVRDVLLVQRERLLEARRTEQPDATPMGRDERVEHDGYRDQDPVDVARQLTDAAAMFAHALDRMNADEWERTLVYNWPSPTVRTLRWLASHTAHELVHHRFDIGA